MPFYTHDFAKSQKVIHVKILSLPDTFYDDGCLYEYLSILGVRGLHDRKYFKPPKNFDNFIPLHLQLITLHHPSTLISLATLYLQPTELKLLSIHLTTAIIEKIFYSML